MITLGHQENDKSFWIFKAAFVWPLLLPLPWPSLSPSIHGILPDWTVYLLLVPTLEFSLITPDPHYSASSSSFSCVFFLVINRNYSYLFYHYFEWVSILVPIFWIVIVIHNERTFQSICKCFWLIFLHLFMKIWTRVSLHLWPKFWCFFKVSPHFCKALVHDLYMAHTLPNFAKRKWIYFLSLSLWGNSFFGHEKNYPYTPGKHICFFWKSLRGIGPSQLLSMAPPTISSNASICYNIEVEFWDNWGSRRTKRLTRLFLGLQPPGSPSKLQGAHTCLEYSIGGQACHLNRGSPHY